MRLQPVSVHSQVDKKIGWLRKLGVVGKATFVILISFMTSMVAFMIEMLVVALFLLLMRVMSGA